GGGAGRPSKSYRVTAPEIVIELPLRHDDVLVELLGRALAEMGHERAERLAEEVGIDYGRAMATSMSPGSDPHPPFQASRPPPSAMATSSASSASTAPSGAPPSSTRSSARSTAAWCEACWRRSTV